MNERIVPSMFELHRRVCSNVSFDRLPAVHTVEPRPYEPVETNREWNTNQNDVYESKVQSNVAKLLDCRSL
jgi:hypothetical protein